MTQATNRSGNARYPVRPLSASAGPLGGKIAARGLVEQMVTLIGTAIVAGRLPAGERIPNEADWCAELGVSRTVLREAISVLASKGLIETRPRVGGRVRERRDWHRLDPAVLGWEASVASDAVFVTELFELRRMIEPAAAAFAAARAHPGQIAALAAAFADMTGCSGARESFLDPDSRFHQIILGAVGNSLIEALASTVTAAVDLSLRLSLDAPERQRAALPLHEAVLAAIRARRPEAARAAMLRLIDAAEEDVRRVRASALAPAPP